MFNLKFAKSPINILLLHIRPVIAYQSYYCYKLLRKKGRGLRPCGCYKDQSVNYKRRVVLSEFRLEVLRFITNM
jgi:hypothetical protein